MSRIRCLDFIYTQAKRGLGSAPISRSSLSFLTPPFYSHQINNRLRVDIFCEHKNWDCCDVSCPEYYHIMIFPQIHFLRLIYAGQ